MSLLKTNEIQNYNGSSLTLTASTVSTSAQLNTGGNISVTGSLNVSDDSTTRTNLGLGTIATQDSSNVSITGGTLGGSVDLKAAINASGSAPIYACRAWVNFDGTLDENQLSLTTGENVYIRDAGNVSSVYYNGTGDYTVNFTTAMPDANYAPVMSAMYNLSLALNGTIIVVDSSSARIRTYNNGSGGVILANAFADHSNIYAAIFR